MSHVYVGKSHRCRCDECREKDRKKAWYGSSKGKAISRNSGKITGKILWDTLTRSEVMKYR